MRPSSFARPVHELRHSQNHRSRQPSSPRSQSDQGGAARLRDKRVLPVVRAAGRRAAFAVAPASEKELTRYCCARRTTSVATGRPPSARPHVSHPLARQRITPTGGQGSGIICTKQDEPTTWLASRDRHGESTAKSESTPQPQNKMYSFRSGSFLVADGIVIR